MSQNTNQSTKFKSNEYVYYQNSLWKIKGLCLSTNELAYELESTNNKNSGKLGILVLINDGDKYFRKA